MGVAVPEAGDGVLRKVLGPSAPLDLGFRRGEGRAKGAAAIGDETAGRKFARGAVESRYRAVTVDDRLVTDEWKRRQKLLKDWVRDVESEEDDWE